MSIVKCYYTSFILADKNLKCIFTISCIMTSLQIYLMVKFNKRFRISVNQDCLEENLPRSCPKTSKRRMNKRWTKGKKRPTRSSPFGRLRKGTKSATSRRSQACVCVPFPLRDGSVSWERILGEWFLLYVLNNCVHSEQMRTSSKTSANVNNLFSLHINYIICLPIVVI